MTQLIYRRSFSWKKILNGNSFSSLAYVHSILSISVRDSITIIINNFNLCTAKNKTKCLMFRIQTIKMCGEWVKNLFPLARISCVSSLNIENAQYVREEIFVWFIRTRFSLDTSIMNLLVISYQNIIIVSRFPFDYFNKSFVWAFKWEFFIFSFIVLKINNRKNSSDSSRVVREILIKFSHTFVLNIKSSHIMGQVVNLLIFRRRSLT